MLYLVHRFTISIKLRPVKLEQAVYLTRVKSGSCSIFDPRAQCAEINITNCDVTSWSWVNLVHPDQARGPPRRVLAYETSRFHVDFWISVGISADIVRDFCRDGPLATWSEFLNRNNQPHLLGQPSAWHKYGVDCQQLQQSKFIF